MHRQGRSPKGSGLFVFMGRAAEGEGDGGHRPVLHFRLVQKGRGFRSLLRDSPHDPEPRPFAGPGSWRLRICARTGSRRGSSWPVGPGSGRSGTGSRKGRVPLGIRAEETAKNNGATMGREAVMIVLVFTIKGCKAHFYHRKSSKRDIPPEIIAKACIIS